MRGKSVKTTKVQGVHKVSLQFQKFITKAVDEISSSDLFHVLSGYQGLSSDYQVHFRYAVDELDTVKRTPCKMATTPQEKAHSVHHGLLKPNRISETSEN